MPTNRRFRTAARKAAYPSWIARALERGHSDLDLSRGLWALRRGLSSIVVSRNREPGGRLDPAVVRTILAEFGDMLLDDLEDTNWLKDNGFLDQ